MAKNLKINFPVFDILFNSMTFQIHVSKLCWIQKSRTVRRHGYVRTFYQLKIIEKSLLLGLEINSDKF